MDAVALEALAGGHGELHLGARRDEDDVGRAAGASASTYAPFETFEAAASVSPDASPSPRSNTGRFWRVRAMPTGPSWRSSTVCQAAAPRSRRPAGARSRPGMARSGRELLDRLVRGAVLAEGDGVVRPDEDRGHLHERRESHGGPHVVAEDEERAAVRARLAVQHDAVHDRAHGVLADAEVQHATVRGCQSNSCVDRLGRDEGCHVVDRREVRLGQVGGAAPEFGITPPSAFSTLPDAARVERSVPPSKTGSASSTSSGNSFGRYGRAVPSSRGSP